MAGGAVGGFVGYALGPLTAALTKSGLLGSIIAGAFEGGVSGGFTQIGGNLLSGKAWDTDLVGATIGSGIGGGVGGGLGWAAKGVVRAARGVSADIGELASSAHIAQNGLRYADEAAEIGASGFNAKGRVDRNGGRAVFCQGNTPACVSVSAAMVIDTFGKKADLEQLISLVGDRKGMPLAEAEGILRRYGIEGITSNEKTIADLAAATRRGNPAIAVIRTIAPDQPLHAVVVDGVTTRMGEQVIAIRNPWGSQYFERASSFAEKFTGEMIETLFSR